MPRILIIEDELIIQMFLEEVVTGAGCEVIGVVDNGEDALEMLNRELPDFILMDVGLQGKLDGIETANLINKRFQRPIVFITGNSDQGTHKKIKAVNPIHIITKPIDENMLRIELNKICKKLNLTMPEKT